MQSASYDGWAIDACADWAPAIEIDGSWVDAELAAWDSSGGLQIWMGSKGRTAPVSPAGGSLQLTVDSGGKTTTIVGRLPLSVTSGLSGRLSYQFDLWDSDGHQFRVLRGTIPVIAGKAMP